jgi:hypothetical protein
MTSGTANWLPLTIILIPFWLGIGAAAQAQQPEPQIAGRVVRADNGARIEGAKVQMNSGRANRACCIHAQTGSNGEYSFQGVPDGFYSITAFAEGFLAGDYRRDGPLADRVQKVNASTRLHIDFRLVRPASISGVVENQDGKSARPGVSVIPVREGKLEDGSDFYFPAGSGGVTDSNGRFAIKQLYPDTYLLCVNCAVTLGGPMNVTISLGKKGMTWYGGTASMEAALPISIKEGEERNDIRIVASQ